MEKNKHLHTTLPATKHTRLSTQLSHYTRIFVALLLAKYT